jgi:predicted DNA-binding protein (UPF0251 family)
MRGRPRKTRLILQEPQIRQFSPRGRIGRPGSIGIKFEEVEAIRLSDHLGLKQRDAARFMGVSQQTFSRVLKKGRKCLAAALIKGQIIDIDGGDFRVEKGL